MRKILDSITAIVVISWLLSTVLWAQMDRLHGDDREYRIGVHAANQFRTSFYNDGTYGGRVNQPPQVAGEWPKNSAHYYLVDGNDFVGSEITDRNGNTYHINSETKCVDIGGSRGDKCGDDLHWCCFLPVPGFCNINGDRVAMARGSNEVEDSWPNYWPDIGDPKNPRYSADGWAGSWNGYFGRDVFNADEESYFVADDWENKEFYPDYMCDTVVTDRGGLGVRVYVRGLEWTKSAVADGIFCIYDIENIGTYLHDKCVFAYKIGNNMGETNDGPDAGDDNAYFVREEDLAYMTDADDVGAGGYTPVGCMGGAFLESPGNRYDGIDNDNDGKDFPGPTITTAMFEPKIIGANDDIIIINYDTFERTKNTLAALGGSYQFVYSSQVFTFAPGDTLTEIGDNLVDDNLNGLVDENRGRDDGTGTIVYLYIVDNVGYKCIDYFSADDATNGKQNLLLDERRDDGIDNDEDWNPLFDDVGTDGLAPGSTGYPGPDPDGTEGNGRPDAGEPHFDQTDINETDMLGLTSFNLYDWSSLNQYDDENYWLAMQPGLFTANMTSTNVELLFGSGYFPLIPGQTERFSVAVICGEDYDDIVYNKHNFAEAYTQNYNFAKAPLIPKVQAIAGDNQVLLFWDAAAEESVDPISSDVDGKDFEGYRIYRSTDPGFNDPKKITDSHFGTQIGMKPLVQFDLDNDYDGYAAAHTQGAHFWLGENTGLRHYYIDDTAVNGFTYYYAVTSYDHGDAIKGIDPTECTIYVAVQASGEVEKGDNVVIVKPEAPAAGFKPARIDENGIALGDSNTASGSVSFTVIRPDLIKDGHKYQITFGDTLSSSRYPATRDFTLKDITDNVILLKDTGLVGGVEGLPITDGFQLAFENNPDELTLNADSSGWSQLGIPAYEFVRYSPSPSSRPIRIIVADFKILFAEVGIDTSYKYYLGTTEIPPIPVNFTIINTLTNEKVPFAFRERAGNDSLFSFDASTRRSDEIIFLADPDPDTPVASWVLRYVVTAGDSLSPIPGAGTTLTLKTDKPFLAYDTFEFTVLAANIDQDQAKADLDKIRVVPNPYIVTNSWEPVNRYSSGRGERQLHFIHLPAKCKIRIFNTRGQLVMTLNHEAAIDNGTEIWDMLSKDKLEISYGIYVYHVEAEGIGEKIGKFAIIK